MNTFKTAATAALLAGALNFAPTKAHALVLPGDPCGVSGACLTFGDFQVYSLAFLNTINGFGAPQPGEPFYVGSSPGQISDGVVIGTGASGGPVNTNFAGMDDAFETPNSAGSTEATFNTASGGESGEPGGAGEFAGDLLNSWDATTAALRGFLGTGGQFIPFFNLNETGTDDLEGIDLQIWVRIWLEGSAGVKEYFVTGPGPIELGGVPDRSGPPPLGDDTDPRWVRTHGTICVDGDTVLHFGPCDASDPPTAADVNQNLGANNAAFAIFNQELNDLILDPTSGYDTLHMDWRMIHENNGYEQAFLLADTTVADDGDDGDDGTVPTPATLGLLGLGLLGLGFARKRK